MPYSAMPSRFLPYDADGTVVGWFPSVSHSINPVSSYPSSGQVIVLNVTDILDGQTNEPVSVGTVWFFPEARTMLGAYGVAAVESTSDLSGSNDTTNGADGTWEAASYPSGDPIWASRASSTQWRTGVKPITFTVAKATLRVSHGNTHPDRVYLDGIHLYGVKFAGQTPDDILFLDGDNAFAEYTVDKDFGDRPLGTTVVKQFKLKNSSATLTATTIVVTCNDTDFAISTDGVTYVTTFTISSLGPGVSSAVLYIRNTTPSPGAALGPRQVRLSAVVGSYV